MNYIPPDENPAMLTSVYPRTTTALAPALVIARKYTDDALRNIHTQLSELIRDHVPPEQTGSFLSTVLDLTCSFWHDMDNLATSQVLLPRKLVPTIWGGRKELLEGMSLTGPPSCSASWPASLVERVAAVPAPKNLPGSHATPTKSHSGAAKDNPESKKKQLTLEEASAEYWSSKERGKEDEEARKQEEKRLKKSTGPVLSLADQEDPVDDLVKGHAPSQVTQHAGKAPTSGAQDRAQARMKHPVPIDSDDEPLSDDTAEPKSKSQKQNTPELIIIQEDDSPLLPARPKATGKKHPSEVTNKEGFSMLNERLKAKVRATQCNNELATLANYRNLKIHDLFGPPNTTNHSEYLKEVKEIAWSYPAQGNVITARQYYDDLQVGCKDAEALNAAEDIHRHRSMMGILKESKAGTIKCRYMIRVLQDIAGQTVDASHSKYGRDWNIGLYDIVSPMSTRKVEKNGSFIYKGKTISSKVTHGYCPFCSYATTNHQQLNNHIRMHLHLTLGCGMPNCWFLTHSSDAMWRHTATHSLETAKPITNAKRK